MSDKAISVGDMVIVVRPSDCGGDYGIGHVFEVLWIEPTADVICLACGRRHGLQTLAIETADREAWRAYGWPTWRLKRIDPLAEPERTDTPRELETH